ncbi:MAG TPA: hypothetical protein VJ437_12505 [Acidiferrobacterales bacterium]|nr:hypothetical protein [Acidiferrobacterales bacterium]
MIWIKLCSLIRRVGQGPTLQECFSGNDCLQTRCPSVGLKADLRPPWMAEVPETQEQFSGRPPWMAEVPETQEQFPVQAGIQAVDETIDYNSWTPAFAGVTKPFFSSLARTEAVHPA